VVRRSPDEVSWRGRRLPRTVALVVALLTVVGRAYAQETRPSVLALDTEAAVEQTAEFFRATGEATHNGVFMLAHEPLVQLLVPSLEAMITQVPQARRRIAEAQRKLLVAIRERSATQASEWMAKHIRDFRRGFDIAGIALERRIAPD